MTRPSVPAATTRPELPRKILAEFVGSTLLAATVVGSGIAAQRLSPGDVGLQLLENALITGAVLVALILALGPVSAAFNPVVTIAERAMGAITTTSAIVLITAQLAGCCLGVMLANLMFDLDAVTLSTRERAGGGLWLAEVVATFGLLLVIFGVVRSGHARHVAYAVGAYITAAYWFTSSTSFANPAITVARSLTDTFAGIAPGSVGVFVLMQLLGGALGVAAVALLYPNVRRDTADEAVTGDRAPVAPGEATA